MSKTNTIGYEIAKVHKAMRAQFNRLLKPYGVTVQQFEIMKFLGKNNGITAAQMVEILVSDSSTIMSTMKRLEAKNIITRRPDERDRRNKLNYLTEQGKSILKDILEVVARYDQQVIKHCAPEELETFSRVLSRLYDFSQRSIECAL